MQEELRIKPNETNDDYKFRVCASKLNNNLTWKDIANIINENLQTQYTYDNIRQWFSRKITTPVSNMTVSNTVTEQLNNDIENYINLQIEKKKVQDYRTQANGLIRAISREETLKDIAKDAVKTINTAKQLDVFSHKKIKPTEHENNATLIISDWHYGLDVNIYNNKFNPDIAKQRINTLLNKTINICDKEDITDLVVVNLGDMISGNIHLPLRINSRIDVISQTMQVAELIAEFLYELCKKIPWVRYISTTDNHSRLDPNKKESLQVESFVRIINWYLRERLCDIENIEFLDNTYGDDIADYKVFDYNILAVHGDKDPQKKIIPSLTAYTQTHWDMILSAHMHHFSADEANETEFFCNGSLIGTDDYANRLRCNSAPSQLLIIHTPENISECIYKIKLN